LFVIADHSKGVRGIETLVRLGRGDPDPVAADSSVADSFGGKGKRNPVSLVGDGVHPGKVSRVENPCVGRLKITKTRSIR